MILLLSILIGAVAGLRAMTAPAAISWAAASGALPLDGGWLAFLGHRYAPWIVSLLAVLEIVSDKLPTTPSRKVPVQFGTRIVMGALSGAAVGTAAGLALVGLALGAVGAVIGTYAGAAGRAALARRFGKDRPAALIEDVVAVASAALIATAL
jgi:uncharacterized membrane protein